MGLRITPGLAGIARGATVDLNTIEKKRFRLAQQEFDFQKEEAKIQDMMKIGEFISNFRPEFKFYSQQYDAESKPYFNDIYDAIENEGGLSNPENARKFWTAKEKLGTLPSVVRSKELATDFEKLKAAIISSQNDPTALSQYMEQMKEFDNEINGIPDGTGSVQPYHFRPIPTYDFDKNVQQEFSRPLSRDNTGTTGTLIYAEMDPKEYEKELERRADVVYSQNPEGWEAKYAKSKINEYYPSAFEYVKAIGKGYMQNRQYLYKDTSRQQKSSLTEADRKEIEFSNPMNNPFNRNVVYGWLSGAQNRPDPNVKYLPPQTEDGHLSTNKVMLFDAQGNPHAVQLPSDYGYKIVSGEHMWYSPTKGGQMPQDRGSVITIQLDDPDPYYVKDQVTFGDNGEINVKKTTPEDISTEMKERYSSLFTALDKAGIDPENIYLERKKIGTVEDKTSFSGIGSKEKKYPSYTYSFQVMIPNHGENAYQYIEQTNTPSDASRYNKTSYQDMEVSKQDIINEWNSDTELKKQQGQKPMSYDEFAGELIDAYRKNNIFLKIIK